MGINSSKKVIKALLVLLSLQVLGVIYLSDRRSWLTTGLDTGWSWVASLSGSGSFGAGIGNSWAPGTSGWVKDSDVESPASQSTIPWIQLCRTEPGQEPHTPHSGEVGAEAVPVVRGPVLQRVSVVVVAQMPPPVPFLQTPLLESQERNEIESECRRALRRLKWSYLG